MRSRSRYSPAVVITSIMALAICGCPAYGQAIVGKPTETQLSPEQKVTFIQSIVLIGSCYREWTRAYNAKNPDDLRRWIETHCGPEFMLRGLDGRSETRADVQKRLAREIPKLKTAAPAEARLMQIGILRDSATVVVSFRYSDSLVEAAGKSAPRSGERITRDTWARVGQRWLLERSEELPALPPLHNRPTARAPAG